MANHTKSQAYKAVLNFFRNTLGFDRKIIGQLVRYAVDRIAKREVASYLASNRWLDKVGGKKEIRSMLIEAMRLELREKTDTWFNNQMGSLRQASLRDEELSKALADLKTVLADVQPQNPDVIACLDKLEELL